MTTFECILSPFCCCINSVCFQMSSIVNCGHFDCSQPTKMRLSPEGSVFKRVLVGSVQISLECIWLRICHISCLSPALRTRSCYFRIPVSSQNIITKIFQGLVLHFLHLYKCQYMLQYFKSMLWHEKLMSTVKHHCQHSRCSLVLYAFMLLNSVHADTFIQCTSQVYCNMIH